MEGIIAAVITGVLTLVGVIVSALLTTRKTESAMKINQAVTEEKLTELTREVRMHNNFAEQIPVIQYQVNELKREMEHLRSYHEE